MNPEYMYLNVSIRSMPFSKLEMRNCILGVSHFENYDQAILLKNYLSNNRFLEIISLIKFSGWIFSDIF